MGNIQSSINQMTGSLLGAAAAGTYALDSLEKQKLANLDATKEKEALRTEMEVKNQQIELENPSAFDAKAKELGIEINENDSDDLKAIKKDNITDALLKDQYDQAAGNYDAGIDIEKSRQAMTTLADKIRAKSLLRFDYNNAKGKIIATTPLAKRGKVRRELAYEKHREETK